MSFNMDRFRFLDAPAMPQAPALPQAQVMPQVAQPFQMPQGIAGLNTQNQFTLPSGETIDLAQIQANLAGLNIPGMQLPSPVAAPSLPITTLPSNLGNEPLPGLAATPTTPVAAPSVQSIDPFASVGGTPINDSGFFQTTPVPTPSLPVTTPAVENVNPFQGGFTGVENSTFGPMKPMTPEEKAASDASFRELMETQDDQFFENYYNLDRGPTSIDLPGGGRQIAAQERFDFGELTPKQYYMQDKYGVDPMASTAPVDTVGAGFDPTQGGELRTADFQDYNNNGTDDRDEVALPPAVTPDPLTNAIAQPTPYTGAGYDAFGEQPFVSGVVRDETGLDATTKQLLFGLDGQGGFIPGAMQAAETTFFNPDGTPRVIDERVAGLTADQTAAMDLARANVGSQNRFLQGAEGAFGQGVSDIGQGIQRGRGYQEQGLGAIQSGIGGLRGELGGVEDIQRGAAGNFGTQLGGIAGRGIGATDRFGRRLGESENLMRGTTGAYDQGLTSQFYNPYEDRVVQQTIDDVLESGDKQDMAARARDIQTGGESAFGSRARLGASERREALGRGLGEALSGIRSRGFSEAQQTGMGEFARQRQAERAASQGLAGLSGARLGAQQNLGSQLTGLAGAQLGAQQNLGSSLTGLAGTRFGAAQTGAGALSNMGNLESQYGQNLANAQFGLGSNLQGLGTQTQQAGAFDTSQLFGQGQFQQGQDQAVIDAQRRNQLQAQQAPLAQYQALAPFVGMAPAGSFQTRTQFTPRPSALQAGLSTGLGAFGAIGNFMNQGKGQ